MKTIIALVAFLSLSPVFAVAPIAPKLPVVTRNDIQLIVSRYAFVYNVPQDTLNKIIQCESSHNPEAQNINEREESFGLSQINLKAHPNISKEQALDPDFAIRYMAEQISSKKGNQWTCFKKLSTS